MPIQKQILAIDVAYNDKEAYAVGVLFCEEGSSEKQVYTAEINAIAEYVPGEFYKRELPCLLEIIHQSNSNELDAIIVDGYVYLNDAGKAGLGHYLYEALGKSIPVIGVAKTKFHNNTELVKEVFRGKSQRPLFITAVGVDMESAAALIQNLHGENRIPDILKKLDQRTKRIE
jgi:deoxyribonuclease V